MSDLSIHNLSLTSRLARLLLFMALLVAQGVLFAATTVQTDLENWQYRWGDSPFIDGKPEWAMPDQQNHSDWLAIPKPAHPPNRQGRENIWYRTTLPETNLIDPVVFISSIDLLRFILNSNSSIALGILMLMARAIIKAGPGT